MKAILVGNTVTEKCRNKLGELGYEVRLLFPFERLDGPVSTHADMLLFYNGEYVVTHRDYYSNNRKIFENLKCKIILSDESITERYPGDVLFNAVAVGKALFSKNKYTSEYVKDLYREKINVKQGYTACSTCRIAEKAFITSDHGLYRVYTENNIDTLLIESGYIKLDGYGYGFIGGASVVLEDTVAFFGNIEEHPDHDRIASFAEKYGKKTVSLSDEKLVDVGGATLIEII